MLTAYQTIEKAVERKDNDSEKELTRVNVPLGIKIGMKLTILCKLNKISLIHLGAQIFEDFVSKYEDENGNIFTNYDLLRKATKEITAKRSTELVTNE